MAFDDPTAGSFFYVLDEPMRLLFVDDDPILREFAIVHLSTDQAKIKVAGDGLEALDQLQGEPFDLILLDLEMPRMDGFEALRRMRADPATQSTPVIVVTGREDVAAIDRAFLAGATSFVVKPINWRLLSYQIQFVQRAHRTAERLRGVRTQRRGEPAGDLRRLAARGADLIELAMHGGPEIRMAAARYAACLQETLTDKVS